MAAYRDVESTRLGRLLLTNVWPAYLFALPLAAKIWALSGQVSTWSATGSSPEQQIRLVQEVVTILFLAVIVLLFILRGRTVGPHADWRAGLVALAGTFLLNVVGFFPLPVEASSQSLAASSVVIVVGTLFTIWSLLSLGRCFGILPEVRGLVSRGPYRWVRHPVYLGELVAAFGMVIAKPHPLVVAFYLLFAGLQYWRTIYEERALTQVFPDRYPAYRARVGRLLPRWR